MSKGQYVRDLTAGQAVADVFLTAEAKLGQAKNGPYWSLVLQDVTGKIEAKLWSPHSQAYPDLQAGRFYFVEGVAGTYRDQVQLNLERLEELPPQPDGRPSVDLADFVPRSVREPAAMLEDLEAMCRLHLRHAPWRTFALKVLGDEAIRGRLLQATGAKVMHHAYVGGLLEHTLSVAQLGMMVCNQYPQLDREVLLVAAVFHDLGKAWELSAGLNLDYTDSGRLLGHIMIGLEVLEPFLRKSRLDEELILHFKHIILSHHGEYEYGSPRRPKTAEAMALHYLDNLDAKMNQVATLFVGLGSDPEDQTPLWSPYQRSLERYLYRPRQTPASGRQAARLDVKPQQEEGQCSLPLKA